MTENEIIQYLKDNRIKGMCYEFFDDKIKDWCCRNFKKLLILDRNGKWNNISTTIESILFYANDIIALPEDKEVEGEWVEFEIDEEGDFCDKYAWWDWNGFLSKAKFYEGVKYTAFGGWQYDNGSKVCKTWHLQPMVFSEVEDKLVNLYVVQEKVKPAIPIKIRFWRK